jgi:hypothetical protein
MSKNQLSFINISERAYKYIRQFTIKSLDDAIIELVTNSDDAYRKTSSKIKYIYIDTYDGKIVHVRDYALGLLSEEMTQCFLQVGEYTADTDSRGFFSRGAKDVSAIGNLTFNGIKNGKYAQCLLNTDAYGAISIADIDATQDIRDQVGIAENGLDVMIELLPNYQGFDYNQLYANLSKYAVLRDILSDETNIIMMRNYDSNNEVVFNERLTYTYPTSEKILDLEYIVPNYPDVTARFIVNKSNQNIEQPVKESQMEFGFLIKDSTTVYEVNTIDNKYRWNPGINYIYGYLQCEGIKKYLLDYDINGSSEKNPYPIIDPSRLTGLNKMHPLIINLMSIVTVRIDLILRAINSEVANKSVSLTDVDDLMRELTNFGLDLMKERNVTVNFTPSYDQNLIKAIQDQRGKYVVSEASQQLGTNYSIEEVEIDNYVKDELLNIGNPEGTYYLSDSKALLTLQRHTDSERQDPIDILRLKYETGEVQLNTYPYIYTLYNPQSNELKTPQLQKLYVFQKGSMIESSAEKNTYIKQKLINIVFINDLNLQTRFIVDRTDGVTIKLNINNVMVKKYLTDKNINDLSDIISIAAFSSTQSLVFMKELITEILTQLIVTNNIENGQMSLDSTDVNNTQKIFEYKNYIGTKIEITIDNIFQKYINNNIQKKLDNLGTTVSDIESSVLSIIGKSGGTIDGSIYDTLKELGVVMRSSLLRSVE